MTKRRKFNKNKLSRPTDEVFASGTGICSQVAIPVPDEPWKNRNRGLKNICMILDTEIFNNNI